MDENERRNDEQVTRASTIQSGLEASRQAMTDPPPARVAHLPFDGIMGSAASVAARQRPSMADALGMPEP